jgi:acyl-CoA synthetase (AMP-forming)/AMP-acid ligase II
MLQDRINLVDVLGARAAQPDQVAYRFLRDGRAEVVEWTYRDVDDIARYIASELLRRGLRGKRIMLTLEPSLLYIAVLFGIMQAGAIAVPSFPPTSKRAKARFSGIFTDCMPELVIADSRHVNAAERISAGLGSRDQRPNWFFLDANSRIESAAAAQAHKQLALQTPIETDTPALLQYTSGSTAAPKGVIVTHGNLIANCLVMEQSLVGPTQQHIACSWLPPYHDMGLMGAIFLALFSGFPLVMMTPAHFAQNPYLWLKAISDHRVTVSPAPNFALELCVDAVSDAELESLDLSSLRQFYCGAEPIQQSTLERFSERFSACGFSAAAFVPCYGMAEATLFVSSKTGTSEPRVASIDKQWLAEGYVQPVSADTGQPGNATARVVSCGQIAAGHELLIVDPAARQVLRSGTVGEIWLRGPSIAAGYWRRPEETAATFDARIAGEESRGAFLRTGDLGFVLDGELFITGRINDVIVIADRHLHPQDIELSAMRCNQFIRANGVVAFSCNAQPQPQLIVVAELSRRFLFSKHGLDEVRHHVRAAVRADHGIVPSVIHLAPVGSIPLTTSGKVRRNACRSAYLEGTLPSIQAVGLTREARLDKLAHVAVLGYD